jgi:hypothetical protein
MQHHDRAQRAASDIAPPEADDQRMPRGRRRLARALGWGVTFLAFPVAGLAAMWSVGAIDDPLSAAVGGAVAGAVIGTAQAFGSRALDARRALDPRTWIAATALGMGLGLLAASVAVGYGTDLAQLAILGAITGVPLGIAQALALPRSLAPRAAARLGWAAATPVVLALGWTVTTLIGVDVAQQYAIFGASGALLATALTGGLLVVLAARARAGAGAA